MSEYNKFIVSYKWQAYSYYLWIIWWRTNLYTGYMPFDWSSCENKVDYRRCEEKILAHSLSNFLSFTINLLIWIWIKVHYKTNSSQSVRLGIGMPERYLTKISYLICLCAALKNNL